MKSKIKYDELFELLSKAELAARNGEWATCGTWAKNATSLAYCYAEDERTGVAEAESDVKNS